MDAGAAPMSPLLWWSNPPLKDISFYKDDVEADGHPPEERRGLARSRSFLHAMQRLEQPPLVQQAILPSPPHEPLHEPLHEPPHEPPHEAPQEPPAASKHPMDAIVAAPLDIALGHVSGLEAPTLPQPSATSGIAVNLVPAKKGRKSKLKFWRRWKSKGKNSSTATTAAPPQTSPAQAPRSAKTKRMWLGRLFGRRQAASPVTEGLADITAEGHGEIPSADTAVSLMAEGGPTIAFAPMTTAPDLSHDAVTNV